MKTEGSRAASGPTAGRAARGGLWVAFETWGMQLVQLLLFLVLARILGPEAYGLIGLALAINVVGDAVLIEGGWLEVLVQRPDLERQHLDSAFWALIATGVALALVALAVAPILAAVFEEPALLLLVPALGMALPLRSAGIVPEALLCRDLSFRPLALRSLVAVTVAGGVAIWMALRGFGVWSLVVLQVLQVLVALMLVWPATSYRPGLAVSRRHLRSLLPFVAARLADRLIIAFDTLAPRLAVGLAFGTVALGHYVLARKLVEIVTQLFIRPLSRVGLSTLAVRAAQPRELAAAFHRLVLVGTAIAAPGFFGMAIVAPELVSLLFGEDWLPVAPLIQVLALLGAVLPIVRLFAVLLFALGRPDVQLAVTGPGVALLVVLLLITPLVSLVVVATLIVLRTYLVLPWQVLLVARASGLDALASLQRTLRPLAATLVMAAAVLLARSTVLAGLGEVALLGTSVLVGCTVYGLALAILCRPLVEEIRAGLGRRPPG